MQFPDMIESEQNAQSLKISFKVDKLKLNHGAYQEQNNNIHDMIVVKQNINGYLSTRSKIFF